MVERKLPQMHRKSVCFCEVCQEGGAYGKTGIAVVPFGGVRGTLFFSRGIFMTRLTSLTVAEKAFLDEVVAATERAKGKKLSRPEKHIVLNQAREQIEARRYADRRRLEREEERQAAEFTWSKPKPFRR